MTIDSTEARSEVPTGESAGEVVSEERLAQSALRLRDVTASTMANIAPAFCVFFALSAMAAVAGEAFPLAVIGSGAAILFLGNTLAEFSKSIPSTGSFVTFIGKAFGPAAAITTVIMITVAYAVLMAPIWAISGEFVSSVMDRYLSLSPSWHVTMLVLFVIITGLVIRGIKLSTEVALVMVTYEVCFLLVASVVVLIVNASSISLAPLNPGNLTNGVHSFGIAFALGLFLYSGWENSSSLAEETSEPRRNVPRAIFTGILAVAAIFILGSYAMLAGFHGDTGALTESAIPFVTVSANAAKFLEPLALIAGVTSVFGVLIAATNAQSRMLFNSAREGLLPGAGFLTKVAKTDRAPWSSLVFYAGMMLALVLAFGWSSNPEDFLAKAGTLGSIPLIVVYIAVNVALPVYWWRNHRGTFSVTRHLLVPMLGVLSLAYPLWLLIQPGQVAPFNQYPYISLGILIVGGAYALFVNRRHPELHKKLGSIIADS